MSFFSEIALKAGVNELNLSTGYNIVNYNGKVLYIEGLRRLLKVEEEQIQLELNGALATIMGKELEIFELSDTIIIKGQIVSMEFAQIFNQGKKKRNEKRQKGKN